MGPFDLINFLLPFVVPVVIVCVIWYFVGPAFKKFVKGNNIQRLLNRKRKEDGKTTRN